jgi:hypothetical protein
MDREMYLKRIEEHYSQAWNNECTQLLLNGTEDKWMEEVRILKYPPTAHRAFWTYATCGMSLMDEEDELECFVYSPSESDETLVGLLTMLAYYHQCKSRFWHGHTVDFGLPWIDQSLCDHGVLLLPYLDDEDFEYLKGEDLNVRFLWLLPITGAEREYKVNHGLEALELLFEEKRMNYIDPKRECIVTIAENN